MSDEQVKGIEMESFTLGTTICKFKLPLSIIDDINTAYDKAKENKNVAVPSGSTKLFGSLRPHNDSLAGKITNEFKVTDILSGDIKSVFNIHFIQYLHTIRKPWWHTNLQTAWINDMKANEYNPFHYHNSPQTDLGLSSVLMLKKPSTYGKEFSRADELTNGHLEFSGGQQDSLSMSQFKTDAQVGELYVFPYTLLHGVYPFNGTDEIRRTLSYNCNLYKPAVIKQIQDKQIKEADKNAKDEII